jgi:hypothetical protein
MKTIKTNATSQRTSSEIDLFSDSQVRLTSDQRRAISEEVGEFLKEQVVLSINALESPISGGKFKKTLSPEYKKEKVKQGGSPVPNLQLSGEMLDSLDYRVTSKGIELGVFGPAALRADGHNNLSGESELPERKFLPDIGESFKSSIKGEVEKIIQDKIVEDIEVTRRDFATIRNKAELYESLERIYPDFDSYEITEAILRNPQLTKLLDEFNLLRFLNIED